MRKSAPSMRDVARHAGVSLGTASRALNNKDNVLPETRSRVLSAAADLGYKLQIRVASPVASKLNTIGVIVKRDPGNQSEIDRFNYGVLCGIEDECQRLGMNVMFSTILVDDNSDALEIPTIFAEDSIDAYVVVGAVITNKTLCEQLPADTPLVFVDGYAKHCNYDHVLIDNFAGAYRMVSYLIEHGHEHIGLIGTTLTADEHPSIQERRRGYYKALTDHGIEHTYVPKSSLAQHVARDAATQLLSENPQITAIFTTIDLIAADVISAINELGLSVPGDVSVVGFDDIDFASNLTPPLTTMRVDRALLGELAVRRLYDRATNPNAVMISTLVGTHLVQRQSVKFRALSNGNPDSIE